MRRVISTVVTVAAFGFAAAICVPAQAQSQGQSQRRAQGHGRDVLGGGRGAGMAGVLPAPPGGLTGALVDGRAVPADPAGLGAPGRLTVSPATLATPYGPLGVGTAGAGRKPLDALAGGQSADRVEELLMTLSDAVEDFIDASADDLASGGSLTGAGTGSWPSPEGTGGTEGLVGDLTGLANGPGGPIGPGGPKGLGDLNDLGGPGDLVGSVGRSARTARDSGASPQSIRGLVERRAGVDGLVDVLDRVLPGDVGQAGAGAPSVGSVPPVEDVPVVGTVTPLVRSAADGASPLLGKNRPA